MSPQLYLLRTKRMQPDTQNVGCNMHSGTLSRQTGCENVENTIARFTLNTIPKTVLLLTQDKLVARTLRSFHTATSILKTQFFWLKTNWLWEHWDYFILQASSSWRPQFFSWQLSCQKPTHLPQTLRAVFSFLPRSICLKPAVTYH